VHNFNGSTVHIYTKSGSYQVSVVAQDSSGNTQLTISTIVIVQGT